MTALVVDAVHKSYGAEQVLAGVDLTVHPGSFTAVLGPSGCGKTTLLRVVAGFDHPDQGTVTLGGRQVAGPHRLVPARQRGIGYVAQEGALFPHLDVTANIAFGLPRRDRRGGSRISELLELVGLDPTLAHRLPHELSGGQQQRVALARALAPRPDLILLDEPFSALDAGLRAETRTAVAAACAAAGTTTVLVTHDQDEALSLADTLAVLHRGAVAQVGQPHELYHRPVDAFTATFLGDAVLLPGTAHGDTVTTELGELPLAQARSATGPVLVVLRPEQLRMTRDGQGLPARVDHIDFYGHDAVAHVTLLTTGTRLRSRTPSPPTCTTVNVIVSGPVHCVSSSPPA